MCKQVGSGPPSLGGTGGEAYMAPAGGGAGGTVDQVELVLRVR